MPTVFRYMLPVALLLAVIFLFGGCGEKRHKVRVYEEQREGEVRDVPPGGAPHDRHHRDDRHAPRDEPRHEMIVE